jgi:hypothetical protein
MYSLLLRRWRQEDYEFKITPGKGSKTVSQNQNKGWQSGSNGRVPSKCEASTAKKKKAILEKK